jgi:hypothetical protein
MPGRQKSNEEIRYMADVVTIQKLTIKATEALYGTKKLIHRKGKRLEVTIPPGVKTGTLVKLSGALQITDGYYGDLFIQIHIKNTRRIIYIVSAIAVLFIIISSIVLTRNTSTNDIYSTVSEGYLTVFVDKQPTDFPNHGKPVHLIENDNSANPSWKGLKSFLFLDKTDEKPYIEGYFECASFAEEVHNNAEARGIKAAFVALFFSDEFTGHAIDAFQTTDKGLVYIDCSVGIDCVAYIEEDKEYGLIPLQKAQSFDYNFYVNYNDSISFYDIMSITPMTVDLVYIYW